MQEEERSQWEEATLKKALQDMAQEISHGLLLEIAGHQGVERSSSVRIHDLLLPLLAQEVVRQLEKADPSKGLSDEDLEARLQKVERKLEKLAISAGDDDEAKMAGTGSSLPNLKYAKPKYKNVESILKYVDTDQDKGGVKLVIMNFND